jgi:hypothetical protein
MHHLYAQASVVRATSYTRFVESAARGCAGSGSGKPVSRLYRNRGIGRATSFASAGNSTAAPAAGDSTRKIGPGVAQTTRECTQLLHRDEARKQGITKPRRVRTRQRRKHALRQQLDRSCRALQSWHPVTFNKALAPPAHLHAMAEFCHNHSEQLRVVHAVIAVAAGRGEHSTPRLACIRGLLGRQHDMEAPALQVEAEGTALPLSHSLARRRPTTATALPRAPVAQHAAAKASADAGSSEPGQPGRQREAVHSCLPQRLSEASSGAGDAAHFENVGRYKRHAEAVAQPGKSTDRAVPEHEGAGEGEAKGNEVQREPFAEVFSPQHCN